MGQVAQAPLEPFPVHAPQAGQVQGQVVVLGDDAGNARIPGQDLQPRAQEEVADGNGRRGYGARPGP